MTYEKPELGVLGLASDAIQGLQKNIHYNDSVGLPTVTAYQADE
jgi:hypothetical protein